MKLEQGDVAVVTGAASGIGFGLAERFATLGLRVVASDIEQDALDDAVSRLAAHGADVLGVRTDVSKEADVQALAAQALDRFGAVHVVCNNAGVVAKSDPWEGPISGWEWLIGVNLWGVIHGVRAFLPHLLAGGRGHIVNTASMAGLVPGLNPIYDATKHAVVALTEDLYHSARDFGWPIGVSVLCPGWVHTNLVDSERNWPSSEGAAPDESLAIKVIEPHLRRAIDEGMTPAAVAEVVTNGIEEDRFFLLTHPHWMPMAVRRWDAIAEGENPPSIEELPDMPSKTQMIEEAFAAMSEDEE
jgi:NAD(P)-dependent dehydrogenase (short-subunit alcohol dehydrogenase family)